MLRRLGREPLAQSVQPIAQRSIVNCVANPNQHAAKQLRGTGIGGGEIAQLLHDGRSSALLERNIRKRVGILQARGLQLGLPCSDLTKPAMSASCVCGVNCFARRDSAPSTASFAARDLSSMRAARSAASISTFAETAIFSASDLASARMRSASAAASFAACSRKPRTSSCSRARSCSASRSLRSASAFAAVAVVIAELIFSALPRNHGGNFLPNTHISAAATIAKLTHLNNSVGALEFALPSSAARAVTAKKNVIPHTKSDDVMSLRSFIEPLAKD